MTNDNITKLSISGLMAALCYVGYAAIGALVAVTTYATIINAVINAVVGVVLYNAMRPVLSKANLFPGNLKRTTV